MPPEKVIWLWPKSGITSFFQFCLFVLFIYIIIKVTSYFSKRMENAKYNWYKLHSLATRRGLKLSEKKILHHFFFQLKLKEQEHLFRTKSNLLNQLIHYFVNLESEDSYLYLELIGKLDNNNKTNLNQKKEFKGIFDIDSDELVAYRQNKFSGFARVYEKLDGQMILKVKGKKYRTLPNYGNLQTFVYRPGHGIISLNGKAQKISHNQILFSAN